MIRDAEEPMDIDIHLRDGKRVDAEVGGYTIVTDQPRENGGGGQAPDPFTLFLASIGTCAGFYVSAYCRARNLPTDEITLRERVDKDDAGHVTHIALVITLPATMTAQQREGILRAASTCKVKKTLATPLTIDVQLASS
jgi:ribosomal protein S12 methylthiotransferase accessory factor